MKIIKRLLIENDYQFYYFAMFVGLLVFLQGYIMIYGHPEKLQNNTLVGIIGMYLGFVTAINGIKRIINSRKKKNVGNIN